jgi:hypothetical protein
MSTPRQNSLATCATTSALESIRTACTQTG